jgi:hypothetical protein
MKYCPVTVMLRAAGILLFITFGAEFAAASDANIKNELLEARWNATDNRLSIIATPMGRAVLRDIRLDGENGTASAAETHHAIHGVGKSLAIEFDAGKSYTVTLYPNLPFALISSRIKNRSSETSVIKTVRTLSAVVDLEQPAGDLVTFGTGGLLAAEKNPGSYAWLSVADPKSRRGIVLGWLSHERGSGVLFTKVEENAIRTDAQIDYGRLRIPAGQAENLETLAVGYFEDARLGLEGYADLLAKVHDVRLKPQPTGYCTWYSKPHGGASDEKHLAELAEFSAMELAPFGFSVVQIDDKWQDGVSTNGPRRNFNKHDPDGPYPGGMKKAADHIKSLGLTPGIWFMPFAGTHYDPLFKERQDWFVKNDKGEPYETKWGGTCLDLTNPDVREYVRSVASRIVHEWGYEYLKLDGLWTGTATPLRYVNSGYSDDSIGDAVFQDPTKTNVEAYRSGLRLVREAIGPETFILGCNGPQNMRSYGGAIGLVDAMRVGPDNNTDWKRLVRGPEFGSRHYFMHGRVWYNDPDPVYVRESMPLNHAHLVCSWVAISGQLNLSSEWLPGLPADRLEILRRTMPSHGLLPRPADLLENDPPQLWLVTDERRTPRRDVIGIFNWDDDEQDFDYELGQLGLDEDVQYAAFDFWRNELAPKLTERLKVTVPGQSCQILAVRPIAEHPQVLSTSRHVTQGVIDVLEEKWSPADRTLRGRSEVVADDPYQLRILMPDHATGWKIEAADAKADDGSKVDTKFDQSERLLRMTIDSAVTQEVNWMIQFE